MTQFGDEGEFRDWLENVIRERRNLKTVKGLEYFSKITKVESEREHPKNRTRPDLTLWHSGIKMGRSNLSNPFFIECKLDLSSMHNNLIQLINYKDAENGEKHGKYHVVAAAPQSIHSHDPFRHSDFYSYPYLERVIWGLGLGLLKKGYNDRELLITFNGQEQVVVY